MNHRNHHWVYVCMIYKTTLVMQSIKFKWHCRTKWWRYFVFVVETQSPLPNFHVTTQGLTKLTWLKFYSYCMFFGVYKLVEYLHALVYQLHFLQWCCHFTITSSVAEYNFFQFAICIQTRKRTFGWWTFLVCGTDI